MLMIPFAFYDFGNDAGFYFRHLPSSLKIPYTIDV